jgi:hypothetical protein
LVNDFNRERFLEHLSESRFVTEEEGDCPLNDRDIGGKILERIQNSEGPLLLVDSSSFAGDSVFCEWAYVIDLDKNVLEVYRGFNHDPLPDGERFQDLKPEESGGTMYYPIKHLITFPLDDLPDADEFVEAIENALPKEEE